MLLDVKENINYCLNKKMILEIKFIAPIVQLKFVTNHSEASKSKRYFCKIHQKFSPCKILTDFFSLISGTNFKLYPFNLNLKEKNVIKLTDLYLFKFACTRDI